MNIPFQDAKYDAVVWRPATGRVAKTFSYDTETTLVDDPGAVPEYVIGSVFDGACVYFIRRQDLSAFWSAHADCTVYMHTVAFDIEVTTRACGFDVRPMVETGLIRDISIYFRVLQCATTGDVPHKYNLGLMSEILLGVKLEKEDGVRTDFARFFHDGAVDYIAIPEAHLEYAARDAVATYRLGEALEERCRYVHAQHTPPTQNGNLGTNGNSAQPWGWLGHDIQLRGDIALRQIERFGIAVDPAAEETAELKFDAKLEIARETLGRYGYVPGKSGNRAVYDAIIGDLERQRGISIPRASKTKAVSQAEDDLTPLADHEFVAAFVQVKQLDKLKNTYLRHLKAPTCRIHPHYTLLVRTGRTSCSSPNVQNLPRDGGVRECIVPAAGHVFITCDYSMLELCTLAQITYSRYGRSVMRDQINAGVDLHRHVAAMVLNKPEAEVSKTERQKVKAIDFGLPGGMGVHGLMGYASGSYGVDLTLDEAERWRGAWLALFPEMQEYLASGDDLARLGETLDMASHPDESPQMSPSAAAGLVMRVAGGAAESSAGRVFSREEINWAWKQIAEGRAGSVKAMAEAIRFRRGSPELRRAVMPGLPSVIPTGRVRADCSYTERHNWPFQALAADGAKLALYDLIRAGYRIVAFVHDEVLVEVPKRDDYRAVADDISRIMIGAMRHVCPDVAIRTEYTVMSRWRKGAKATYDEQGRLVPYEDSLPQNYEPHESTLTTPLPTSAATLGDHHE